MTPIQITIWNVKVAGQIVSRHFIGLDGNVVNKDIGLITPIQVLGKFQYNFSIWAE